MSCETTIFNNRTEAETVALYCDRQCQGKFIVITGASIGGIGFEAARALAKYGADVLLCCHTQKAGDLAVQSILASQPNASVQSYPLDLSSIVSIQDCASYVSSLTKPINVLINNAGVLQTKSKITTIDGFDLQWQVNYLGPFYFTKLLLPLLIAGGTKLHPARVVMTSSILSYIYCSKTGIDYDRLRDPFDTVFTGSGYVPEPEVEEHDEDDDYDEGDQGESDDDDHPSPSPISSPQQTTTSSKKAEPSQWRMRWRADFFQHYAESKLANIMFAKELTKRMSKRPRYDAVHGGSSKRGSRRIEDEETEEDEFSQYNRVIAVSLRPGICLSTRLYRSTSYTRLVRWLLRLRAKGTGKILRKDTNKSIAQAAATTVFCAVHPHITAGELYADCQINDLVHDMAKDEKEWKKLWEFSEQQLSKRIHDIEIQDRVSRMTSGIELQETIGMK